MFLAEPYKWNTEGLHEAKGNESVCIYSTSVDGVWVCVCVCVCGREQCERGAVHDCYLVSPLMCACPCLTLDHVVIWWFDISLVILIQWLKWLCGILCSHLLNCLFNLKQLLWWSVDKWWLKKWFLDSGLILLWFLMIPHCCWLKRMGKKQVNDSQPLRLPPYMLCWFTWSPTGTLRLSHPPAQIWLTVRQWLFDSQSELNQPYQSALLPPPFLSASINNSLKMH